MLRPKRERRPGWDAVPSSRVNGVVVQVLHLVTGELERENIYPEKSTNSTMKRTIIINHIIIKKRSMLTA